MPTVLVVDDSPTDRLMASRFLEQEPGLNVHHASNGNEALAQIREQLPDAVVTDLQMPECDGLQLVDFIKEEFPRLPVILMTAQGSEDIAAEALRKGAASYVPKRVLAAQLRETVVRILSLTSTDRQQSRLMHSLAENYSRFDIQNDAELIEALVLHLQETLRCLPLNDESERMRVALAVKHALLNGLFHGNLELPLETEDMRSVEVASLIQDRLTTSPYADRLLVIESRTSPQQATFVIRHEGPGFPLEAFRAESADPCCPRHFTRGLVLMHSIMDDVQISNDGRTVSLAKKPSFETDLIID